MYYSIYGINCWQAPTVNITEDRYPLRVVPPNCVSKDTHNATDPIVLFFVNLFYFFKFTPVLYSTHYSSKRF